MGTGFRNTITGKCTGNQSMFHISTLVALLYICRRVVDSTPYSFTQDNFWLYGDSYHIQLSNPPDVKLVLDKQASAGFQSKETFLSGIFSVNMKLVPANSAGTATTFYLHSGTAFQDELDFEFLGNVSGQPYKVHTNVFTNGVGSREQQMYTWFDPTHDFHNYKFVWNRYQVVWYIDEIPIRVFRNLENFGIKYLTSQSLYVRGSIFDASQWATRGGLDKINYTDAPFVVNYKNFDISACTFTSTGSCSMSTDYYWQDNSFKSLSWHQENQLDWVRKKYLIYDYCTDKTRYSAPPPECAKNARLTARGAKNTNISR